jgi:positive regulator of sigma E activity
MNRQNKLKLQRKRLRRFFWLFAAAAISALLFEKQEAVLLVLWTLTTFGLLMVVAFSRLEAKGAQMQVAAIRSAAGSNEYNIKYARGAA